MVLDAGALVRELLPHLLRAGVEYRERTKKRREAARVFAKSSALLRDARLGGVEEVKR